MLSLSQIYPMEEPSRSVRALWADFKSTCHLLCVRGTPSHSELLAVDMDMYASVDGPQQPSETVTGLLLPLWHARVGTAALQSGSKWVYS